MTEAGIGRILVASLHQGIVDLLPTRLPFYENWLNSDGLRHGTIGLAPFQAVLSFLRQEGEAYRLITERAGEYAGEWTVASQSAVGRSMIRALPRWIRTRAALRVARRAIRDSYVGTRAIIRLGKGRGTIDVRASLFCGIREPSAEALCQYYAAVVGRVLELYTIRGEVTTGQCRAKGDAFCVLELALDTSRPPKFPSIVGTP
ncbi:MAG TPA: hypothetical protein VGK32_21160 [Vicinamibacterales bacterium]|jgi:hypothetical protein